MMGSAENVTSEGVLTALKIAVIDFCMKYGIRLVAAIVTLIVGSLIIRLICRGVLKSKWYGKLDKNVHGFTTAAIKIALYAALIVCIVAILGIPMASVAAIIASCGVAIGLALQGSLSNLAGGLMLLIFKPFRVGDYIETKDYQGTVDEIGIFSTSLTTVDNRRVFLPNASLSNSNLSNNTYYEERMVQQVFPVDYDAPVDLVCRVLKEAAETIPELLPDKPIIARFCEFDGSSSNYQLRVWCKSSDYWNVYYAVLDKGKRALTENGIKIPYPIVEVKPSDDRKYE